MKPQMGRSRGGPRSRIEGIWRVPRSCSGTRSATWKAEASTILE